MLSTLTSMAVTGIFLDVDSDVYYVDDVISDDVIVFFDGGYRYFS